ncbi:Hypothetical protein PHPALM_18604 [Phytophthora palmivora]|uniref:FLYWCH-type domain-containing protein n=1 Tax=Phytophthora palmivora TaxID=4796 RepID=A0A2P4XJC1_9STRA|nr:Hypothetical protein PHPALM_18604 [Phytophthora palmivora]
MVIKLEMMMESEGRQVEDELTSGGFILPDSVEPVSGSKSVHVQGYQFSFYHGRDTTRNYRCSSYRRTQCLAKLYISRMGVVVRGNHKSDCIPELRQVPNGPPQLSKCYWRQMKLAFVMLLFCREKCGKLSENNYIATVTSSSKERPKSKLWVGCIGQGETIFGLEIFGQIEIEQLCDVKHSPGPKFFQFHFTYYEDEFYRLVVVMMYDPISDLYLPVWYVLTSGKTSQIYDHFSLHLSCIYEEARSSSYCL